MDATTEAPDVSTRPPKKRAGKGEPAPAAKAKPATMSMKLPMDVIESARVVAALKGETITDIIAEILRPALAKMEREEIAKRARGQGAK